MTNGDKGREGVQKMSFFTVMCFLYGPYITSIKLKLITSFIK